MEAFQSKYENSRNKDKEINERDQGKVCKCMTLENDEMNQYFFCAKRLAYTIRKFLFAINNTHTLQ